jgi:CRP-like cAMP-binding protein
MGTFTGEPRSATAIAAEDVAVLFFDQHTAIQLLRASPQFGLDLIRTLCRRIRALNERLLEAEARARQPVAAPAPVALAEVSDDTPAATEEPGIIPYDD